MVSENWLEATCRCKMNVHLNSLNVTFFTFFCKFLSDEVETLFWESKGNPSTGL